MTSIKIQKIEILQKENPILKKVSSAIPIDKIKTSKIKNKILLLKNIIDNQSDAAAISAIQIGEALRLFLISKKVFIDFKNSEKIKNKDDLIFINPKIIKISKNKQLLEEGCLSVKYVYGKVLRPEKINLEAFDENGKKFSRGFSGLLAQIVQHEIDHLNGILFIDKAIDIQKISPEEYEKIIASSN